MLYEHQIAFGEMSRKELLKDNSLGDSALFMQHPIPHCESMIPSVSNPGSGETY